MRIVRFLLVITGVMFIMPVVCHAQNECGECKLKGVVTDSITGEGEPYATISIINTGDKALKPRLGVTDVKGRINESVSGSGEFTLTVSSIGRKTVVKNFTVSGGQKSVELGTLYISDADNELKGVEVVAQKPLVKADIDKITYDIEADPEAKTSTVIDMLRKVPMVTVDGEDNIKVNGSSSFKVYVNGKPNSMMSNNPKEVLKSMPANTIKNIEVITNPGPKYDAEGVGGILNIITTGSGVEGYTATLSANAGNRLYGGAAFTTVKKGKLTVSANYNYNHVDNPRSWSDNRLTATGDDISAATANILSKATEKGNGYFQSGTLEAGYEIDSLRLVSMSFNAWDGGYKRNGSTMTQGFSPFDNAGLYGYNMFNRNKDTWCSIEGGIDYQRMFKKKGRMLTLSYRIESNPSTSDGYVNYGDMTAVEAWTDYLRRLENQHANGEQTTTEHTFQADYTTPIGKAHTIETGVKYIIRDNRSENDRYVRAAADGGDYAFDNEQSRHYSHRNDITAAYLGYGISVKKWSGRFGLRYEHTSQDVKYIFGRGDNFKNSYDDLVPSTSIGLKLGDTSNLRAGYKMRISRPGISYLNPYINDSNPMNISQGNPNLKSEKSHQFDISYGNFSNKLNINLSLTYSFTNNSMESISSLVNDNTIAGLPNPTGKDVIYSTYANIGNRKTAAMQAYVSWNMTKTTVFSSNMYGSWSYYSDGNTLMNKGWSMFAYGGIQQTLPKDWKLGFNLFGVTPQITPQGRGAGVVSYSMSVNKSLMKKRLTLSLMAHNIFKKYSSVHAKTESAGFLQTTDSKFSMQMFALSVSYRIGELKAGVKKATRSISNDDVKGGGQKNASTGETPQ